MIPSDDDRTLASIRAIVRSVVVEMGLAYAGRFAYSIQGVRGAPPDVLLSCTPLNPELGLPDLVDVAMSPDVTGMTSAPDVGATCEVEFLNRDPTLPRVVGVGGMGAIPIARVGDQVMVFFPPVAPIVGVVNGTTPFVGTITIASPTSGVVTQGSGRAFSG
jgi:hypothetical protein